MNVVSAETQKKRIASFIAAEWSRLVSYVRGWIADTAERDAEDVVQDVIERLFEKDDDMGSPIVDLSAYLYRSLRNKVIDLYRKPRRTAELPEDLSDIRFEASEGWTGRRPATPSSTQSTIFRPRSGRSWWRRSWKAEASRISRRSGRRQSARSWRESIGQ